MSQGTVYHKNTGRELGLKMLVADLGLDVKFSEPDATFVKEFPFKRVPAYISGNYTLSENIAIAKYLNGLKKDSKLFGTTPKQEADVLKWISFCTDLAPVIAQAFLPLAGFVPFNKKSVDTALASGDKFAEIFNTHLKNNTYLVGERVTVADYVAVGMLSKAFNSIWDKTWAKSHPYLTRWYLTLSSKKPVSNFVNGKIIDEAIKFVPPKKEKKEAPKADKPKAAEKPKAVEDDEPPKEKKAAHPLAALGNAKVPIDEWKRTYSNEETREAALPWFWEHYDPEEYSLWKVAYKYNDELTLTFMSNNLVGGFFNRLSGSTKYLFGCMVVYGENNNNGITGVFLVRGQDYVPAFDVAPDWESYEFTKLDASKPEVKEYVNDLWAWDKPLEINGEKKEIADGKVFK